MDRILEDVQSFFVDDEGYDFGTSCKTSFAWKRKFIHLYLEFTADLLNRSICILLIFQRKYFQLLSFIAGLRRHGSAKLFYISCYLGFHSSEYKVLSIAHAVVVQENEIAKATRLSWLDIEA